jgi:stress response protein SCP2
LVNVVLGWWPIPHKKNEGNLSVAVLMFNADGVMVDNIKPTSWSGMQPRKACRERVVLADTSQFALRLGLLSSEFFCDRINLEIALDRLPPDVSSIVFVTFAQGPDPLYKFRRKFLRIVDPASAVELAMFNYRIEYSEAYDALLVGGLYFERDLWAFKPSGKQFQVPGGYDAILEVAGPLWVNELVDHIQSAVQ